MAKISPSILSLEFFCKNSFYLRVRLRERFVNPQLLKQLVVYKIKELLKEQPLNPFNNVALVRNTK